MNLNTSEYKHLALFIVAAVLLLSTRAASAAGDVGRSERTSLQGAVRLFSRQRGRAVVPRGWHHRCDQHQHRGRQLDGRCAGTQPQRQGHVPGQLRTHAARQLVTHTQLVDYIGSTYRSGSFNWKNIICLLRFCSMSSIVFLSRSLRVSDWDIVLR